MTSERRAHIVDVWMSEHFDRQDFKPRYDVYGTSGFRAPEIALFKEGELASRPESVRPPIDVFAWGCMLLGGLNKQRAFVDVYEAGTRAPRRKWSAREEYRKQNMQHWCDARRTWSQHWQGILQTRGTFSCQIFQLSCCQCCIRIHWRVCPSLHHSIREMHRLPCQPTSIRPSSFLL